MTTETKTKRTTTAKKVGIVAAIANAMKEVGKLAKANKNEFANYKFTSIDDFLAATNEICANNGIVVVQDVVGYRSDSKEVTIKGQKKMKNYLVFDYTFRVMHESGEELPLINRPQSVEYVGAQSYGIAQSYALKQFLRALFQISTGEEVVLDGKTVPADVDAMPNEQDAEPPVNKLAPDGPIAKEQMNLIIQIAKPNFPGVSLELFVQKMNDGKSLDDLTAGEATKFINYLTNYQDISLWPDKFQEARKEAIRESEPEAFKKEFGDGNADSKEATE